MSDSIYKLGTIGAGNMATAMLRSALTASILQPDEVLASRRDPARREHLHNETGVHVTGDNAALIQQSAIVMLALKPQQAAEFLTRHGSHFRPDQVLFSVLAGTTTTTLRRNVTAGVTIVRTMPNTPAQVGKGVTLLTGDAPSPDLVRFLNASGSLIRVDESQFDHATAISGCGPAYIFLMAEAMARAGVELGLDPVLAERLANETLFGAAALLEHAWPEVDAPELRHRVTSPGGATAAAIGKLQENELIAIVSEAAKAAQKRAEELG